MTMVTMKNNLLNVKCAICSFNTRLASCVAEVCVTNVTSLIINMSFNLTVNDARADDSNSNNNNNNMIQHTSCIANLCVTNVTIFDNQSKKNQFSLSQHFEAVTEDPVTCSQFEFECRSN